jgi:hypothetical protein
VVRNFKEAFWYAFLMFLLMHVVFIGLILTPGFVNRFYMSSAYVQFLIVYALLYIFWGAMMFWKKSDLKHEDVWRSRFNALYLIFTAVVIVNFMMLSIYYYWVIPHFSGQFK